MSAYKLRYSRQTISFSIMEATVLSSYQTFCRNTILGVISFVLPLVILAQFYSSDYAKAEP